MKASLKPYDPGWPEPDQLNLWIKLPICRKYRGSIGKVHQDCAISRILTVGKPTSLQNPGTSQINYKEKKEEVVQQKRDKGHFQLFLNCKIKTQCLGISTWMVKLRRNVGEKWLCRSQQWWLGQEDSGTGRNAQVLLLGMGGSYRKVGLCSFIKLCVCFVWFSISVF